MAAEGTPDPDALHGSSYTKGVCVRAPVQVLHTCEPQGVNPAAGFTGGLFCFLLASF